MPRHDSVSVCAPVNLSVTQSVSHNEGNAMLKFQPVLFHSCCCCRCVAVAVVADVAVLHECVYDKLMWQPIFRVAPSAKKVNKNVFQLKPKMPSKI